MVELTPPGTCDLVVDACRCNYGGLLRGGCRNGLTLQTIALTSVLPLKVVWHSTTRNQMTLSETQHQELLHMCKEVKALDPRWQVKAASKAQQAPNGGSS